MVVLVNLVLGPGAFQMTKMLKFPNDRHVEHLSTFLDGEGVQPE